MPARAPRRALARLALLGAAVVLAGGACVGPSASPTPVPAGSDSKTEARVQVGAFSALSVDGPLECGPGVGSVASCRCRGAVERAAAGDRPTSRATTSTSRSRAARLHVGQARHRADHDARTWAPCRSSGGATGTMEVMQMADDGLGVRRGDAQGNRQRAELTVTTLGGSTRNSATSPRTRRDHGGRRCEGDDPGRSEQLTGTIDGGSIVTLAVTPVAKSVAVTGGAQLVLPYVEARTGFVPPASAGPAQETRGTSGRRANASTKRPIIRVGRGEVLDPDVLVGRVRLGSPPVRRPASCAGTRCRAQTWAIGTVPGHRDADARRRAR